jgi:hypothetical protein
VERQRVWKSLELKKARTIKCSSKMPFFLTYQNRFIFLIVMHG